MECGGKSLLVHRDKPLFFISEGVDVRELFFCQLSIRNIRLFKSEVRQVISKGFALYEKTF